MRILLIVTMSCCLGFLIWGFLWTYFPYIARENQIVENIQASCLLIGFVFYCYSFFKSTPGSYSILFIGLSIFYLTFSVRELELEESQSWFAVLTNPPVRDLWLTAAWVVSLLIFLRNMRSTLNAFFEWIKEIQGILLMYGGLFYLFADLFDKNVFSIGREESIFVEESLEFNAAILMVISAACSLVWAKRQVWWYGTRRVFR